MEESKWGGSYPSWIVEPQICNNNNKKKKKKNVSSILCMKNATFFYQHCQF
jgi:hypothetical protein